ncbi:MAG: hypothetical protein LBE32_02895 [Burkholderiales bacterium]|jgi:hypothetical protein|nr:hypothetical protein [Burkholderiales bacterium]
MPLIAVTLFALAVLINWRDEVLSDEARALLEARPMKTVPDNENIFVAMAGFNAPEGDDIFEAGGSHIEEIEKALEQDPWEVKTIFGGIKEQEGKEELRWQETEPSFDCRFDKETDFLGCARSQKERIEKTLAANETLVYRYGILQELPYYVASRNPGALLVMRSHSAMTYVRIFLVAQALLDVESGNAEAGLTFFKKDLATMRRILEGKGISVDNITPKAHMTRSVYRLSLLLSSPSINVEGQPSGWRELLEPLSREQISLRSAIEGDIRRIYDYGVATKWVSYQEATEHPYRFCSFKKSGETCSTWQWWLDKNGHALFFQPNAKFNYGVPLYKTWLRISDLSRKNYIEQREEALASLTELSRPGIDWIYNPVGKGAFRNLSYYWDDYYHWGDALRRLYDLDAYLRLVRLQLELRLAKILSEDIPAFIEQLDEAYCAPCSDFSWDAETRMLSFQPYNESWFTRHASPSVYVPE